MPSRRTYRLSTSGSSTAAASTVACTVHHATRKAAATSETARPELITASSSAVFSRVVQRARAGSCSVAGVNPDLCQLVSCGGIAQAGERLLCVAGQRVGGGDGLVASLDGDGVVAAQGLHEPGDAPRGGSFDHPADGEGRHDDGEVGFDRVAFVVVDRPCT